MFIDELITRSLILVFGYAYPAFQCFKTLEKNKVGIEELRFWCQYWLLVTVLSILEVFFDVFISWIPFYRGIKLITYIYLWHPGTKGSSYIYDTMVQPYVAKYEGDIDRTLAEVKERVWDLALSYWYNCAHMRSKKVVECLQVLMSQCMNAALSRPQSESVLKRNGSDKKPPVPPASVKDNVMPKSDSFKVKLHSEAQYIHPQDVAAPNSTTQDNDILRRVNTNE